ncbi:hypothetical protein J2T17_002892 [Paenibacillus mucilaginosus]
MEAQLWPEARQRVWIRSGTLGFRASASIGSNPLVPVTSVGHECFIHAASGRALTPPEGGALPHACLTQDIPSVRDALPGADAYPRHPHMRRLAASVRRKFRSRGCFAS